MERRADTVRIAAIADVHYGRRSRGALQSVFSAMDAAADILALCGDFTESGQPEEAGVLVRDLAASVKIPMVGVMGNHDFEAGKAAAVKDVLAGGGIAILDGEATEIEGIGFAGVKGFCGGFDRRSHEPWGEDAIKLFVREAVEESLKLGSALARLRTPHRIALLHYAPIRATVEGEPLEIFPFLGSSRMEEPLDRYSVTAAFHGHAHHGHPSGTTKGGVPVHNVAVSVLRAAAPDRPPFFLLEVPAHPGVSVGGGP